jgi:hypothetical protein
VVLDALRSSPHTAGGDHPEALQHSAYRLATAPLQVERQRPDAARHPLVTLLIVFWPMIARPARAPAPRRSIDETTAT